MIFNKNFYQSVFFRVLTLLVFLVPMQESISKNMDLIDDQEYSIKFFSENHDNQHVYNILLKVSPKSGWKIFARNNGDTESLPEITFKKSDVTSYKGVVLSEPEFNKDKNAYVYKDDVFIPIKLHSDQLKDHSVKFESFVVMCKDGICINKKGSFSVDLAKVDHDQQSYEVIKLFSSSESLVNIGLLSILGLSLLGGFILNFMPCVLPVISLKIFSVIKSRENNKNARKIFAATSLGIIFCFLVIGVIIYSFKSIGQHVGLGFNFQHPVFVVTVVLIIMFLASILNDTIYFDIPSSWKVFLLKHSEETKLFGSFASGMFLTILATPCTAPFLGVAVSMALTLSVAEIFLSFIFMGVGMALPFMLLSFFPNLVHLIPSPGPWLNTFKKFVEVVLYLTVFWLLWILSAQLGVYPAIALFLSCLLLKFFLTNRSKIPFYLKVILISVVVFVSYTVPIKTSILEKMEEKRINDIWQTFEIKKISDYVDSGDVVIVDITADWCLSCKYNKIAVLENPFIIKFLRENKVVGLRGDYTNESREIEKFLESYSQYGIPFTVVFSKKYPSGIILPTILKHSYVINTVKRAQ